MGCTFSKKAIDSIKTMPPLENSWLEQKKMYVALYDYKARDKNDMSFKEQDQLEILDDTGENWYLARNSKGNEGWIPSNYVAPLASITAESWYFGKLSRPQADKLLRHPKNQIGAFLIRESDSKSDQFVLSVRHLENIKHYRIRKQDQGGYFISQLTHFSNLQELVRHYSNHADGLCCALISPCTNDEKPNIEGLAKDKWEIPRKELRKGDLLGTGQFGEVYKGSWNRKIVVAIKMLKADATEIKQFLDEAQLMKKLAHPKLVQLYGVCTVNKPVFIVTEFMVNGSLLDYLRSKRGQTLSFETLIDMAAQVARGMAFLEKNNYIHRDLAARNVLVGEDDIVKVGDFGLARAIPDSVYESRIGVSFPVKWTAIEAINYQMYSIKSDVWSFGIFLTELVTYGRVPYPGLQNHEVITILTQGYRMDCPPNCPENLYMLMRNCWDQHPQKRPTFATLQYNLDDFFSNRGQYLEDEL